MIFGNPKEFAIEAYHEPSGAKWGGCGRLCLHVNGVPIGDIRNNHCSLFAISDRFRGLSSGIDQLWDERFVGLTEMEVFRFIDEQLYIGSNLQSEQEFDQDFDFLTNTAEMFDRTKTFIYCESGNLVHVLYRVEDAKPRSEVCDIHAFKISPTPLYVGLTSRYEKLAHPIFQSTHLIERKKFRTLEPVRIGSS